MKKLNYLALFSFGIFVLSGCAGLNKMQENASKVQYTVTPQVLEEHGDNVAVKIDANYPAKYFNKKATLTITPVLKYQGGETKFQSKTVQGESVTANNQVISYNGGSVSYSGNVPFKDDMMKSELVVRVDASMKKKSLTFPDYKIADGVIATPKLVMIDPKPLLIRDNYKRIVPAQMIADILYVINRADIRPSELKKEDVKSLQDLLTKGNPNPQRMDIKNLEVSAYASPDGPLQLNDKLAQKREGSADSYLKKTLKKSKLDKAQDPSFILSKYTAEDWEGFKKLMEESNIRDKELILRVLSMYSDPQVREKEIKNISAAYKEIAAQVLPELRRSKLTLNIDKIGHSDEEIKSLLSSSPDSLNVEEMLYGANLYQNDLQAQANIYQKAASSFPNDYRASNNLGYTYILMGDANKAQSALDKAKSIKNDDVVNNNLGCVALMKGDVDKAKDLFTSSMGADAATVGYNLGIISVIKGDYDAAAKSFGNSPTFNTALVKYLKKDNQGAMSTLNSIQGDFAKKSYLKAIVAAKQDQTDLALENLRTAISQDPKLKDRAKVDMEFAKLFENDAFKNIVK